MSKVFSKHNVRSRFAVSVAQGLSLRVCYWVLIRMGVRYVGGPTRSDEVVPDVTFLEVLNRCGAELRRRHGR